MSFKLGDLFSSKKPLIGMIHLAGNGESEVIRRALEELAIYSEEGIDGAIIEDYVGSPRDIENVLRESERYLQELVLGVNCLSDPYSAFKLAMVYGAKFVQFDSVQAQHLDLKLYEKLRREFPQIAVLGGVGFKESQQPTGNSLEEDLRQAKSRCEVIVTTGSGTGIETPIEKLREYKAKLGPFPLFVGAGVTAQNVSEQLGIADGAIVGSYFKLRGDVEAPVNRNRVRKVARPVRELI